MNDNDLISRATLLNECAECQKTDPHFEERGWASHFMNDAGEPSTEWYCVEDMIENAPTVDAIPVEWLQRRRDIYLKAYHAGHESEIHTAAILNDTLMAWQREQEAR